MGQDNENNGGNGNGNGNGNGGGNGNGNESGNGSGGEPMDPELTLGSLGIPGNDVQWNEFSFANYIWMIQAHVMDPLAVYDPIEDEFVGLLAEDWNLDSDAPALEVTINDDYHWHDGEEVVRPVDANDVYINYQLELDMEFSTAEYVNEVTVEDEQTVTFHLADHIQNENFVMHEHMFNPLPHGMAELYEEWVERFEDASSDDEMGEIRGELSEHSIPTEDMLSYGPFALSEAASDKITAVKNEGHPAADDINFPRVVWPYYGEEQQLWQALMGDELDGHVRMNPSSDVVGQFPDYVESKTFETYGGFALAFNLDGEQVGDRRVRRALGFVVDKEAVVENVGSETREPVTYNTGVSPGFVDDYLDTDQYTEYTVDHERATALLEDAGYTNEGGEWYLPNGDRFGPAIKTGSTGGPDLIAARTVATQLQQFGIDANLESMEGPAFESSVWETSDFEIAGHGYGAAAPEPFNMYNNPFRWDRESVNLPEEIELPEIGDHDGEPGAITLQSEEALNDLTAFSGDKLVERTNHYAWAWEYLTPWFMITHDLNRSWFTNDEWEYPALDSDIMERSSFYTPFHYILKTGEFRAKTQ
ncbi:ABC transporter substrate-binding protein [Halomontanus rarus]|uniref:ABC transporter substrate-binding protein n=1 Tax=Halomontanus rarus TaxID=3034020 RepID=UPI0023E8AF0D|nr:ABC transporter substrate-binding protein [Halovivax sp. TS33]